MGHGYIDKGKQTSFVSKKELAWHKLGKVVDAMTSEEAIVLGGLDFEVGLRPIFTIGERLDNDEVKSNLQVIKNTPISKDKRPSTTEYYKRVQLKGRFATVRTDNHYPLGIVGSRYQPIQNKEAFDFFDSVIGEGHTQYETAGALGNGEVIFITAKLPEFVKVQGDIIDSYLLFTMAHDGSGAIQAMFTPIRVVCNNTLSLALERYSNKVTIRHTKSAKEKMQNLDKVMGMTNTLAGKLNIEFDVLQNTPIRESQVEQLMLQVLGLKSNKETGELSTKAKNILESSMEYYNNGFGQKELVGTAYGALNGVTGYLHNERNYRSDISSFSSNFLKNGTSDAGGIRQKAFDILIDFANKEYVFN